MWTKIFVLVTFAMIASRASINGYQFGNGYSYGPPSEGSSSTIQASLAYYVNIPANHQVNDQLYIISSPEDQYTRNPYQYRLAPPPDLGGSHRTRDHYYQQTYPSQTDLNTINNFNAYDQLKPVWNNFYQRPPSPTQSYQTFIPNKPVLPSITPPNRFQPAPYQIDPRSRPYNQLSMPVVSSLHQDPGYKIQESIEKTLQENVLTRNAHRQLPYPSQELLPPPYTPHVTLQAEPNSIGGSPPKQYRIVPSVASLPMSYNARLPFPLGVVPIKFRPLPLKTHLRQAGLLPITSYQAKESYRK